MMVVLVLVLVVVAEALIVEVVTLATVGLLVVFELLRLLLLLLLLLQNVVCLDRACIGCGHWHHGCKAAWVWLQSPLEQYLLAWKTRRRCAHLHVLKAGIVVVAVGGPGAKTRALSVPSLAYFCLVSHVCIFHCRA